MKTIFALALTFFMLGITNTFADTTKREPIIAMGAYVPSDDIPASVKFYRELFDLEPIITLADFVAFNVQGGWFAIVSRTKYAPDALPGSGAVPYMQSGNLETLRSRLLDMDYAAPNIIQEPGIEILKITDPNGQLIEFFKLTGG